MAGDFMEGMPFAWGEGEVGYIFEAVLIMQVPAMSSRKEVLYFEEVSQYDMSTSFLISFKKSNIINIIHSYKFINMANFN